MAVRSSLVTLKHNLSLPESLPEEGVTCSFLGLQLTLQKAPFSPRSSFTILASNIYMWSHFAVVFFNLMDFVKDITFATAVQHFDTNIVQSYSAGPASTTEPYEQYRDFNVHYVFVISVSLMIVTQVITFVYWSMITRKPRFLQPCEHQGLCARAVQLLVQYVPCTLPILLFAQDATVKLELGQQEDAVMDPDNFHNHLELLSEERLVEKLALNIKIIEVVVEAYGQLIIQSVVLLRLKSLIQTDFFKYFGISFEYVIIISMVASVFSIFATFWSYHTRSKQCFRQPFSLSTLLQLVTWILLIATKLFVYVIAFINFPALFFVPVLMQFLVTATILSFTNVSPSFRASPWHDRVIHCMVDNTLTHISLVFFLILYFSYHYLTSPSSCDLSFSFCSSFFSPPVGVLCAPPGSVPVPPVAAQGVLQPGRGGQLPGGAGRAGAGRAGAGGAGRRQRRL